MIWHDSGSWLWYDSRICCIRKFYIARGCCGEVAFGGQAARNRQYCNLDSLTATLIRPTHHTLSGDFRR
ncbi:hypothetical protein KCP78_20525 [Salmonella enterica subsp. enterica]|nr:hypothetical protein KCP78_20525 [Salmonella enterica subsp. enterica]